MQDYEGLKYMIEDQLNEYARRGKLGGGDLAAVHMLTDTYKNLCKIKMLQEQEGGESHRSMRGSYDGGMSGRHYVRGHYSRDGGSYDGGSYSEDSYGGGSYDGGSYEGYSDRRYSRAEGKEHIMKQIEEMMHKAQNSGEKEALRRCLSNLERA